MSLNPKMSSWQGKVVWLIGASSGIGLACARSLHQQGAHIIVSARSAEALDNFTTQHAGSLALPLSVEDAPAMTKAAQDIRTRHGKIDMVVYCAGHYCPQSARDFDSAQMQRHMSINYTGAVHMLDAILPIVRQQGFGHISLVASVAGYRGLPKALAYGPTKAALIHLGEALYLDLHSSNIGVSVVNPGFVATPLTAQNNFKMPALLSPEQAAAQMLAGWQAGRFEIHFPKRFTSVLKLMQILPYSLYFYLTQKATS